MDLLSEFDFKIKQIKGKVNRVVDALRKIMQVIQMGSISTYELEIK